MSGKFVTFPASPGLTAGLPFMMVTSNANVSSGYRGDFVLRFDIRAPWTITGADVDDLISSISTGGVNTPSAAWRTYVYPTTKQFAISIANSINGTGTEFKTNCSLPFDGNTGRCLLQCEVDMDNGGGSTLVRVRASTDGLNFTQVGTDLLATAVSSRWPETLSYGYGYQARDAMQGDLYRFQMFRDLNVSSLVMDMEANRFPGIGYGQSASMRTSETWQVNSPAFVSGGINPPNARDAGYFVGFMPTSAGAFTDISSAVDRFDIDRKMVMMFDEPMEGRATAQLNNEDGRFSPYNTASALYPNFMPGRLITIRGAKTAQMNPLDASSRAVVNGVHGYLSSPASGWSGALSDTWRKAGGWYFEARDVGYLNNNATRALAVGIGPLTANLRGPFTTDSAAFGWVTGSNHLAIHAAGTMVRSFAGTVNSASVLGVAWNGSSGGGVAFYHNNSLYHAVGSGYYSLVNSNPMFPSFGVFNDGATASPSLQVMFHSGSLTYPLPILCEALEPTYNLFNGRIIDVDIDPAVGERTAIVELNDSMARLKEAVITTSLFANTNPGSIFTTICSLANVNSFHAGVFGDVIPLAWYRETTADKALMELVQSGRHVLFEDGAGTLIFRTRFFAVQGTLVQSMASSVEQPFGLSYRVGGAEIINRAVITGMPRKFTSSQQTVGYIDGPVYFPGSTSISFGLNYIDPNDRNTNVPANSLVTPVSSSDFLCFTNSDGTGTNFTSSVTLAITLYGETAIATLTNVSTNAGWLTKFQIRGFAAQALPPIISDTAVNSSRANFGPRDFALESRFMGTLPQVRTYSTALVIDKKDPQPAVSLTRKNMFAHQLAIDLGDTFSAVDSNSALNGSMVVRGIRHGVALVDGLEHVTTYDLTPTFLNKPLILNHPIFGKLDTDRELS